MAGIQPSSIWTDEIATPFVLEVGPRRHRPEEMESGLRSSKKYVFRFRIWCRSILARFAEASLGGERPPGLHLLLDIVDFRDLERTKPRKCSSSSF